MCNKLKYVLLFFVGLCYSQLSAKDVLWTDVVKTKPSTYVVKNDTILLKDKKAVAWLASVSNGLNGQEASTFEGKVICLMQNVDMNEYGFSSFISTFSGVFDGCNHVISNLNDSSNTFCRINEGVIKNLERRGNVAGVYIKDVDYQSCACIAADNMGTIENCRVHYTEMSFISSVQITVGVIAANNYGTIERSYTEGHWIVSGAFSDKSYLGGIAAYNSGTIRNCKNSAIIDGYCKATGGIAAVNQGYMVNCANTGELRSGTLMGGLCGIFQGTNSIIENSYNTAVQNGNGLVGTQKGGILRNCYSVSKNNAIGKITNSTMDEYIYVCADSVASTEKNVYTFSGVGRYCQTTDSVFGKVAMPDVLNMWSTLQDNDEYSRWTEDRVGINKGYPIFTWELDENMYEKPYELWVNVVKERPETYVEDGDVIYIGDERAFAWMASVTNGLNGCKQDVYGNKTVYLLSDVNMAQYEWTPLKNFAGVFKGNDHVVKGIFIEDTLSNVGCMLTNSGVIQDLKLLNASIYVYTGMNVKGAILVADNKGKIENCETDGDIRMDGYSADCSALRLGGLVAVNTGSIVSSASYGKVFLKYESLGSYPTAENIVGGVVADNQGVVNTCINNAEVDGMCYSIGGIAGRISGKGKVLNCANKGYVTKLTSPNTTVIGGLVGYMRDNATIYNSYNSVWVDGCSLVGVQYSGKIGNCYKVASPVSIGESSVNAFDHIYSCADSTSSTQNVNYTFSGNGRKCTLSEPVYQTTSFVEALNAWVKEQGNPDYLSWGTDLKKKNNGYPTLIETVKKDTTFYVCPDVDYYGKIYTSEDDSVVQAVTWNDTLYENAKIILKVKFDGLTIVHRSSFVVGEVLNLAVSTAFPSTYWKLEDGTSYAGVVYPMPVDISFIDGKKITVTVSKSGCSHELTDSLVAKRLEYDTLIYVCPEIDYYGREFTDEDDGTIQVINWNREKIKARIVLKANFSKVKYKAPSSFCIDDTVSLCLSGADSYIWKLNSDTLYVDGKIHKKDRYDWVMTSEDVGMTIDVAAVLNGCEHHFYDTIRTKSEPDIVYMEGWGDVLAINNSQNKYVSFQWYFNGGVMEDQMEQYLYQPEGLYSGTYTAVAYKADGTEENLCSIVIAGSNGKERSMQLQPTLIKTFDAPSLIGDYDVESIQMISVVDSKGNTVCQGKDMESIDFSGLQDGLYIICIRMCDDNIFTSKFSVKR